MVCYLKILLSPEPLIFLVLSPQRGVLRFTAPRVLYVPFSSSEVNQAAAVIAVLGLALMALGCLCIIMVLSKVQSSCSGLEPSALASQVRG